MRTFFRIDWPFVFVSLLLVVTFCILVAGCAADDADTLPPTADVTASADAGEDQTIAVGQVATLRGKLKPDNLPVCWSLKNKPHGSQSTLATASALIVTIKPDVPGQYKVALGCTAPYADDTIVTATPLPVVVEPEPIPPPPTPPAPPVTQPDPTPPPPAPPVTPTIVTLHFVARLVESGNVIDGTFSYALEAAPTSTNMGGMANVVFTPISWHFATHSTWFGEQAFTSALPGHTAQWCVGVCTFGSGQQVRFNGQDEEGHAMRFSFALAQPMTTAPQFAQIGTFNQAGLNKEESNQSIVFRAGTLTEQPPVQLVTIN